LRISYIVQNTLILRISIETILSVLSIDFYPRLTEKSTKTDIMDFEKLARPA